MARTASRSPAARAAAKLGRRRRFRPPPCCRPTGAGRRKLRRRAGVGGLYQPAHAVDLHHARRRGQTASRGDPAARRPAGGRGGAAGHAGGDPGVVERDLAVGSGLGHRAGPITPRCSPFSWSPATPVLSPARCISPCPPSAGCRCGSRTGSQAKRCSSSAAGSGSPAPPAEWVVVPFC